MVAFLRNILFYYNTCAQKKQEGKKVRAVCDESENFSTCAEKITKKLRKMLDKRGEWWYIFSVLLALEPAKC
jgi:hypothetical protein